MPLLSSGVAAKWDAPCPPAPVLRYVVRAWGYCLYNAVPRRDKLVSQGGCIRPAELSASSCGTKDFVPGDGLFCLRGWRGKGLYGGKRYTTQRRARRKAEENVARRRGGGRRKYYKTQRRTRRKAGESFIKHRGGHGGEAGESIIKHRGGHGGRQGKVL